MRISTISTAAIRIECEWPTVDWLDDANYIAMCSISSKWMEAAAMSSVRSAVMILHIWVLYRIQCLVISLHMEYCGRRVERHIRHWCRHRHRLWPSWPEYVQLSNMYVQQATNASMHLIGNWNQISKDHRVYIGIRIHITMDCSLW